ncbi:MAG: hypothetical protein IKK90_04470 [Bacteroides sp.]|nr:hypothetical protein [Bacteroides sp.]
MPIPPTRRLPNRIYPYYLLVKLYAEHSDVFPKEKLEQAARMVMEKERTFNQEVEHFCRVLEAEIKKKEC